MGERPRARSFAFAVVAVLYFAALLAGCGSGSSSVRIFIDARGFNDASDGDAGDTILTAEDLGRLTGPGDFLDILGRIRDAGDEDWFEIDVAPVQGELIVIQMSPPFNEDYDIEVFDAAGNLFAASRRSGDDTETVAFDNYIGAIFVRVYGPGGEHDDDESYLLTFEHEP
jgi:hypothetical protein